MILHRSLHKPTPSLKRWLSAVQCMCSPRMPPVVDAAHDFEPGYLCQRVSVEGPLYDVRVENHRHHPECAARESRQPIFCRFMHCVHANHARRPRTTAIGNRARPTLNHAWPPEMDETVWRLLALKVTRPPFMTEPARMVTPRIQPARLLSPRMKLIRAPT